MFTRKGNIRYCSTCGVVTFLILKTGGYLATRGESSTCVTIILSILDSSHAVKDAMSGQFQRCSAQGLRGLRGLRG